MRFDGTLTKWNDDRGFGFVTPDIGDGELFAHISAFPKGGERPTVGERISFEVAADSAGRKKALNIAYLQRPSRRNSPRRERPAATRSSFSRLVAGMLVLLVAVGGYYVYGNRSRAGSAHAIATPLADSQSARFSCDGRTHCSQMTSCAEATYFLRHCPGVEMDGDHDGVPCEQQWCTTPFSE
ncbi:excalibur calcium-binding domain-containing protein [Niveibacterium sp.]|uniref:excalibur calcium-binding domain-containing protein n=1 Tax=Niveibacterium sp. TaxID=2017444 RepID=UPI0035B46286